MQAYKEKFIKDLNNQDTKVAISGIIVDKKPNSIIVDDNTGNLPIIIETDLNLNTFVRVFGSLVYSNQSDQPELHANVIQDLNNVNKQLYQKVKLLLNQKQ